ncbi:hypothetical protein GQ600_6619 [Phytophthora cactorum]|nr:hypothetical protein GQ600_6619 [Phytophthora cactorum]
MSYSENLHNQGHSSACFAIRLPESELAKDYWLNQVVRKHLETDRMVVVGRSTVHPYVKDSSHPTGVSFIDDARLTVNDCKQQWCPADVCQGAQFEFYKLAGWDLTRDCPSVKVGILQSVQDCSSR